MQKLLTLIFIFAAISTALSQNVSQSQMAMSDGINNAYTLSVEEPIKFTKSVWKEYMSAFGKVKKNKQKELESSGASVASLASRPVNVFATFEKMGKEATLVHVWIQTEEGYFSAENEGANANAIEFLEEFKKEVIRTKVRKELKTAEKALKKEGNHLTKLIKSNDRLHKSIQSHENKIQKARENLEKNEKEQEKSKSDIEKYKEVVEEVKKRLEDI